MTTDIKFRAVIPERNATLYFTLDDLVNPEPPFSIRELLLPWLRAGNTPDRFAGFCDREGMDVYEGDVIEFPTRRNIFISIEYGNDGGDEKDLPKMWRSVVEFSDGAFTWEWKHGYEGRCVFPEDIRVIGNVHEYAESGDMTTDS